MRMQLRVSTFERFENLMEHFETTSQSQYSRSIFGLGPISPIPRCRKHLVSFARAVGRILERATDPGKL